ncbi:MAG: radical SAM protein, partial [Planctomycetaceae bacterium]
MTTHSRMSRHRVHAVNATAASVAGDHLPVPMVVQWMATLRCGRSCPHCLAADDSRLFVDMPLSGALSLIDQVADMGVPEFLLTGGEPLARADMPAIIDHLAARKVSYSINTATYPQPDALAAMKQYPPTFVAVSLDGPEEVHDAFRGSGAFAAAMRAFETFASLPSCVVTAGTTVTAFNFDHLAQTMAIVASSPAGQWGLHLVVPEGRAAARKDLMLTRKQLRNLMDFVAVRRKYFPVSMADEFGYCGDFEPLVRDEPLVCGAGRAQCVVLPDGSVVPCTTLDRTVAAGNIHEHPLAEIWRDGFTELRNWRPAGKCRACDYALACGGGCWLQRRQGKQCFKEIWHVPGVLKTAAGVIVCMGAMGAGDIAIAADPPADPATVPVRKLAARPDESVDLEFAPGIERLIMAYYSRSVSSEWLQKKPTSLPADELPAELKNDPAYIYVTTFTSGKTPRDIAGTAKSIDDALKTKQQSLALASLMWRHVSETLLDSDPTGRTADERKAVRQTLASIQENAETWRKDIFTKKLDPYLERGRTQIRYRFEMSKALIQSPDVELWRQTQTERWGAPSKDGLNQMTGKKAVGTTTTTAAVVDDFLTRHPLAENMRLAVSLQGDGVAF